MCPGSGPGPLCGPAVIHWWLVSSRGVQHTLYHPVSRAQSVGGLLLRKRQSNKCESDQGSRAMELEVAVMTFQKEVSSLQAHFTGRKTETPS